MRLKAKKIGNEVTIDEYNAYQYLLYHMDCWKERVFLNTESGYQGNYAHYTFQSTDFLINDKDRDLKVRVPATSSAKISLKVKSVDGILNKEHMEYSCTLYFLPEQTMPNDATISAGNIEEVTGDVETYPEKDYKEVYQSLKLPCEWSGDYLNIYLWDKENDVPYKTENENKELINVFDEGNLIYRWLEFDITFNSVPWIDLHNGKVNEPFEILIDSIEQLKDVVEHAPTDGTQTIVRLDSNKTYYIPDTLHISDGQDIEIKGGTSQYIDVSAGKVRDGQVLLDATFCKGGRTFVVEPGGNLTLTYVRLKNNNCTRYGTYDIGRGGAVLVEAIRQKDGVHKFGLLEANNCTFVDNKARVGGAIFSYHAGVFLNNCTFYTNYAYHNGGAVYYWANDIRLRFDNLTVLNGSTITLKVRVTDYLARLVGEGEVDFYLKKSSTEEQYLATVNVGHKTQVEEIVGLPTVSKVGTVKLTVTDPDTETKDYVVIKNNLPVTIEEEDGTVHLKPAYVLDKNNTYVPAELDEGEVKKSIVFKRKVKINNVEKPLTRLVDDKTKVQYLDYSDPELFYYIVYLDEIIGYDPAHPTTGTIKNARTDNNNELGFMIRMKNNKPVMDGNHLKNYYKKEGDVYKALPLDEGESSYYAVFKKKIGNKTLPYTHNNANDKNYLTYSNSDTLNFMVLNQSEPKGTQLGWASVNYTIPDSNKSTLLQFIAVYKGGAMYDSEVAMNNVTVVFPEKYTATWQSKNIGEIDDIITLSVKVTDKNGVDITKPKGVFEINNKKYNATNEGENYFLKFKVPEDDDDKIPVKFTLEKSMYYEDVILNGTIKVGVEGKEDLGDVTALFVNAGNIEKGTLSSSTDKKVFNVCTDMNLIHKDKQGANNDTEKVKTLQTALKELGYYSAKIDGIFGDLTETAVKNFQKKYGLKVDGEFGPITCGKLNEAVNEKVVFRECTNIWLEEGSKGENVKTLQTALKELKYYTATVDGDFGNVTATAVKNFQSKYGLKVDGKFGPVTCGKLNDVVSGGTTYVDTNITDTLIDYWATAGITDVFVRCLDYNDARQKATLETALSRIENAKTAQGRKIRVHAVLNTFRDLTISSNADNYAQKSWGDASPASASRKQFIKNQIELLIKNTKIDGICFDYLRFSGLDSDSYNGNVKKENRKATLTSALKEFKAVIAEKNNKLHTSACVMPEETEKYGQDFKEIIKIVDYIMPMAYKGNYRGVSQDKDSWVTDVLTKQFLNKKIRADKIICCIQTYSDDTDLNSKVSAGKTKEALRPYTDLLGTITVIAQCKAKGYALFREGLLFEGNTGKYPSTYAKVLGSLKTGETDSTDNGSSNNSSGGN
ncbi:MAG: hypothetical protein BZ138_07700 [Methanosphaera sp. rholeuAM270]|nr:MAG: hypothetical protein BZ138_07700 [Methanosphaera sp. rholeuAM270]